MESSIFLRLVAWFGFGFVCGKALDKVLQIADLFLFFLFWFADELLHQLAGFVPKS